MSDEPFLDDDPAAESRTRRRDDPRWWLAAAALFALALWGWSELRIRVVKERMRVLESTVRALREENHRLAADRDLHLAPPTTTDSVASSEIPPETATTADP